TAYLQAVNQIDALLKTPPETCQKLADEIYSLKTGVKRYQGVYRALKKQ
ncbi:MAG: hypothetical protein ACI9P8_001895, partial [Bacteroidia bacterium]